MNKHPEQKISSLPLGEEIPLASDDGTDDLFNADLTRQLANDEEINLDDALDDDNENPVSHTLIDAAENSGAEEIRDTQELEGEEQESQDRVGSLSPLYKQS
ncbi:MAG: hypothetical protein ABI644_02505 [Arenimonas sp.]